MDWITHWDRVFTLWLNGFAHVYPRLDAVAEMFQANALYQGGILFALLWYFWYEGDEKARAEVVRIAFGIFAALVVSRVLQLWLPHRLRPLHDPALNFVLPYGGDRTILEHWSSFPSDHAAVLFAMIVPIWRRSWPLGLLAAVWVAFFACLTRIYVGFHYPSDIVGGAILGTLMMIATLRMPVTSVERRLDGWLFHLERTRPAIFYTLAFLFTDQLITFGDDTRALALAAAKAMALL